MATDTRTSVLRDVALFRGVPEDELDALARRLLVRQYTRNQLIFSHGDPGDGLYIVVKGHVSISRQNPDGDELIFGLCEPGEYFGELSLFDGEPRSATATSVDDSSIFFLPRGAFREFLTGHPGAVLKCLEVVVGQLRRCTELADEVALLDVRSRLAKRLLRLSEEQPIEGGNGAREQGLRVTQQQLANMLGATR